MQYCSGGSWGGLDPCPGGELRSPLHSFRSPLCLEDEVEARAAALWLIPRLPLEYLDWK